VLAAIKQQSRPGGLRRHGGYVTHNPSIEEPPVVVKKYANRRLYNTKTSTYVTLEHLCEMVKGGIEFEVRDARTGEDITRSVLTQIIFEEEAKGQNLLPIRFLRQLIKFYGDSLQAFVPGYLDLSMESFAKQQDEMRRRMAEAVGGGGQALEALARQNLAIFEKTMRTFTPFGHSTREPHSPPRSDSGSGAPKPASADEVSALKNEIEAMRRQLAEIARNTR
jgi:polyhydroxyalkanoate synthesis repressor PhaR